MKQVRLDEFVAHLRTQDLSRYTVDGYRRNVAWFFAWLKEQTGRDMPLAEVTTFDLQRYRDHLIDAGRKPSTINRRIAALRAFFAWAVGGGYTTTDPTAGIKSIQHKRRAPKGLSKQQVYLLQRQAAARRQLAEAQAGKDTEGQQRITPAVVLARRDEAILAVLIYTGLRVGELVNLRLRDVEINARSGKVCVYGKGRGKKYREVPLHVEARKALEAYLDVRPGNKDGHLFFSQRGPLKERGVQFRLQQIGEEAKVEVSPHKLRHTFASQLLREAGVDLVTTSTLMGHESVNTTAIYTQPTEADLEAAVDKLP